MDKPLTWRRLEEAVGAPVTQKDWQWLCQYLCEAPANQAVALPLLETYWRRLHSSDSGSSPDIA